MASKLLKINNFLYNNNYYYKNIFNSNKKLAESFKSLYNNVRKNKKEKTQFKRIKTIINQKVSLLNEYKQLPKVKPLNSFKQIQARVDNHNAIKKFEEVYKVYKTKKSINEKRNTVTQNPLKDIMEMTPDQIFTDNKLMLIHQQLPNLIIKKIKDGLLLKKNNIYNITSLKFFFLSINLNEEKNNKGKKIKELIDSKSATLRYTEDSQPIMNDTKLPIQSLAGSEDSEWLVVLLGYQMLYNVEGEITKNDIRDLRAFHPCSNRKYHELTYASTNLDKLCIYMTFLDMTGKYNLKYMRRNKETKEEVKKMLKNEGAEIEKAIKKGELINSLELLTKKYDNDVLIVFYASFAKSIMELIDNEKIEKPILISKGKVITNCKREQIFKFINKKIFLYDKNVHVAPALFKLPEENGKLIKNKEKLLNDKYKLRPLILKTEKRKFNSLLGFDCETYKDANNYAVPYCITLYGELYKNNKITLIEKFFYGSSCMIDFVNYINKIKTDVNKIKSRPKNKIDNIFIYGFNNARFDNLLIYKLLYKSEPKTKFIFAGNSIKYIKYNNVYIMDFSLQYAGNSLRNTATMFGLEEEKGVYPYEFDNANNMYYIGEVPELKYWNNEDEYNEYIKKNGNIFNKKEYSIKYCMLDSKLVYELAKIHLNNTSGKMNNKIYNADSCPTSANLSLKIFQQCFLEDNLEQSPNIVIVDERESYHGGRTSVFKSSFDYSKFHDQFLYYVDINSAHPSGMTLNMPYKYIKTINYRNEIITTDYKTLTDEYLYYARTIYKGNDKYYIPNLLHNIDNKLLATKNAPYSWYWGKELKEAIKDNCEVIYNKCHTYEKRPVFKKFIEYFYGLRCEAKKEVKNRLILESKLKECIFESEEYNNLVKLISDSKLKFNETHILYYKAIINSLYGKFGQKEFAKSVLVKDVNEMYSVLKGDIRLLKNWQFIEDGEDGTMLITYKELGDEYNNIGKLVRFSSYIACTTRCKLADLMRNVGHKNVYYCDTDSIFTTVKPDTSYIDSTELGKWSYECDPIIKARFLAPKVYYYETIKNKVDKKCKGIKASDLTINDYDDLSNGIKKSHTPDTNRTMFFRSLNGVRIEKCSRTLSCVLNKRKWKNGESEAYLDDVEYFKNSNKY